MVYIDINDDKEKKKLSIELEKINIDHNDITITNKSRNSIIICENDLEKIKEYKKNYNNLLIYNKKNDALLDKVYYKKGVYTFKVFEELNTIFEVIKERKKIKNNTLKAAIAVVLISFISILLINSPKLLSNVPKNNKKTESKTKVVEKNKEINKIVDYKKENFVFFGDSITEMYDVEKYFPDLPVVNAGFSGYTTTRLLAEMDEKLLVYNPTKVFILIGTNDIGYNDLSNEEIVSNVSEIVQNIKKDRKNVKIYIESIYPVNETYDIDPAIPHLRENSRIREINEMYKELCNKEGLTYIDLYSKLKESDESIDDKYTLEGLHINQDGYKFITDNLIKYVKEI